jgi:outer membrane protein TolC
MKRSRRRSLPKLPRLPLLASGLPLLGLACAGPPVAANDPPAIVARAADTPAEKLPPPTEKLPPPTAAPQQPRAVPVSLDTVLRLACDQNAQIALAREKVRDATAQQCVAELAWLPNVYLGMAYWRHEGGIQAPDGTLVRASDSAIFAGGELNAVFDPKDYAFRKVDAERRVWQQKGELSRISNETLLEATTTYIDLLMARTSEAIARETEKHEGDLFKSLRDLVKVSESAKIDLETLEAETQGHRLAIVKVRQQGDAAASKLAYLLGMDPSVQLMPIDDRLAPFALADSRPPVEELVARALANGPGVRELEGLLSLVQSSMEKAKGPGALLPIFEVRMAEGAFGAGPGDSMTWDNRWDLCVQARWNLTDLVTARDRQRVADSKLQQIHLTQQDLRGKLASGVHEAREAIVSGGQEILFGAQQIKHATRAYERARERWQARPPEYPVNELQVLQALRAMELAHVRYLEAVSAYDKAQLRLLLLTGAAGCGSGACAAPEHPVPTDAAAPPATPSWTKPQ